MTRPASVHPTSRAWRVSKHSELRVRDLDSPHLGHHQPSSRPHSASIPQCTSPRQRWQRIKPTLVCLLRRLPEGECEARRPPGRPVQSGDSRDAANFHVTQRLGFVTGTTPWLPLIPGLTGQPVTAVPSRRRTPSCHASSAPAAVARALKQHAASCQVLQESESDERTSQPTPSSSTSSAS